jgi:predicted nucleotide-binding protein
MLKGASEYQAMLDKTEEWIEEHVAGPRREGRAIVFAGKVLEWSEIYEVHITYTDRTSKEILASKPTTLRVSPLGHISPLWEGEFADDGTDVTNRFITGAIGSQQLASSSGQRPAFAMNRKAVMVIYGHDLEANNALFGWLRSIGLQPREWSQLVQVSGSASPYIGQVLEEAFRQVQAVIALFTPDERVRPVGHSGPWRLQARPNVLIEAGMALVAHPSRTVLVTLGSQELPSDLAGRHYIRLNNTAGPLNDIANRLQAAGCEIDRSGTDWLDPTRFPNRDNIRPSPSAQHGTQQESPRPSDMTSDEASVVSGDGVYLVGLDIQPGMYRTAGPKDSQRGSCYYALLSSTNTQDIITNNNVSGPAIITIESDVKAVHFSGCKPWQRLDTEAR